DQDAAIAGAALDAGRGIIVVANKWDLMKSHGPEGAKIFDRTIRDHFKFLDYAPILHVSAETGERTGKLLETVDKVMEASRQRVSTGELNRFIRDLTEASTPICTSPTFASWRIGCVRSTSSTACRFVSSFAAACRDRVRIGWRRKARR